MSGLLGASSEKMPKPWKKCASTLETTANEQSRPTSAAAGTILRGLEAKSQTEEGAERIWEMLRKQAENQGNIPANAPSQGSRVQVKELDPKTANDMMKAIFGKDAPEVEGGCSKVITLDPGDIERRFLKKYYRACSVGCLTPPKGIPRTAPRRCRKS